jgi:hypothetical protein
MTDHPPGVTELKKLSDRLSGLLSYPQLGLVSWRWELAKVIAEIDEYGGRGLCTCRPRITPTAPPNNLASADGSQ